jgi:tRNA G18 (ribose-2'-O)-methylase SpoU
MPIEVITNLDDPRLLPYRNLKATNVTRWSNQFIAEGLLVVERLLKSEFPVVSILVSRRVQSQIAPHLAESLPVYLVDSDLAEQVVGFTFHTGVLACGLRRPGPTVDALVEGGDKSVLLAVCPNVNDPENLGAIIRLCAGFGVAGLILGTGCADPFTRRVLRVSMGQAFSLPIVVSRDLRSDLLQLRDALGVELAATVLGNDAEPLESARRTERMAVLFGNEKHGLGPEWIDLCRRKLTIPMSPGADSLNVAVAAGIFFHHLTSRAARPSHV